MTLTEQGSFGDNANLTVASRVLSTLFMLMSVVMFGVLIYWIATTDAIFNSEPTVTMVSWSFINSIGIIRPLLIIGAAALLMQVARGLAQRDISSARWAVLIYNWLLVGTVFMTLLSPILVYISPTVNPAERFSLAFNAALPYGIGFLLVLVLRQVVAANAAHYTGEEDINLRNARRAWNLLVPTILVILVIALTPLERVFITSLTDERFASSDEINFIGLANYTELWSVRLDTVPCNTDETGACIVDEDGNVEYPRPRRYFERDSVYNELRYNNFADFNLFGQQWYLSARDLDFIESLFTSIYYTVLAIVLQFTIGFFMAMIIAQKTRGIGIMRVVMLVPLAIPTLIATQFWEVMLRSDQTGLINSLFLAAGWIQQPQQWLLDSALQVPTLVAVIVWKETPFTALLLLPGFLAIPKEVYQAGAIDGANRVQRFFLITLPLMRPTIGIVLVLRTMVFLRVFDLFDVLVGSNRYVLATYAHDVLIQEQQLGYSSAISVTIFIVTMAFTIAYMRALRIDEA
ncbi:MAG: sugar ABC transporter permease [Chloroflexota bacterium]